MAEIARSEIRSVLREVLTDPDAGMVLQKNILLRLKKSLRSKEQGKTRPLFEVLKKYGL